MFVIMNPFCDIEVTENCNSIVLPEMDEGYFFMNGIQVDGKIDICVGDVIVYKRLMPPKDFRKKKLFWPARQEPTSFEN